MSQKIEHRKYEKHTSWLYSLCMGVQSSCATHTQCSASRRLQWTCAVAMLDVHVRCGHPMSTPIFFFFFFIVFSLFFPLRRLPFVVYICFDIYKAIFQRNYRGNFFGVVCVSSINSGLIIFPVSDNVQKWSFKYQLFFKAILNMYFFNPKKSKKLKIELQKLIGNFRIETKTMNIKI